MNDEEAQKFLGEIATSAKDVPAGLIPAKPVNWVTTTGVIILVVVSGLLLGALYSVFFIHAKSDVSTNHLSNAEYDGAKDGIYEVNTIATTEGNTAIVLDDPFKFMGSVTFNEDTTISIDGNNSIVVDIDTLVTDVLFIPNPDTPDTLISIVELINEVIVSCGTDIGDQIQDVINQITTLIQNISVELIDYQDDLVIYEARFDSRNTTFFVNQQFIDSFNLTCNGSEVDTFIIAYNTTEDRLNVLLINHQINVLNYTLLLDQYNNVTTVVEAFLTANCSSLLELTMDITELTMDYEATVVYLNATRDSCETCGDAIADSETTFNNLVIIESALDSNIDLLDIQTQQLGNTSNILYSNVNETLIVAQTLTTNITDLLADFTTLNNTLLDIKTNATILRDLAENLDISFNVLIIGVDGLNTTVTITQNLIDEIIANCSGVNITNVQEALTLVNTYIANITDLLDTTTSQFILLQTAATDITTLELRLDAIELNITLINTLYNDATARFLVLNATYTSLLAQYQLELTRYTTLLSLLSAYQIRYDTLNTTLFDLTGVLDIIEAQQITNGGDLTTNENRILALEPDLGCNNITVTTGEIGGAPGFDMQFVARQNMTRGTPVTLAADGRLAPAQGLMFSEQRELLVHVNSSSIPLNRDNNFAIDVEDSLYFTQTFIDDDVIVWGILNHTFKVDPTNTCFGINQIRDSYVAKVSPAKEISWVAHIGGSCASKIASNIEYDAFTDSLWVSVTFSKRNCEPDNVIRTVEFFNPGELDPTLTFSYDTGPSSNVQRRGFLLAQIARNGRWMGFEVISYLDTNGTITGFSENQFMGMSINTRGMLAFQIYISQSEGGFWKYGENFNSSLVGAFNRFGIRTVLYNTATKTFLWERAWVQEFATLNSLLPFSDIWVDYDGEVYECIGFLQIDDSVATVPLVDGSTVDIPTIIPSVGFNMKMFVSRSRNSDGGYIWAVPITNNGTGQLPYVQSNSRETYSFMIAITNQKIFFTCGIQISPGILVLGDQAIGNPDDFVPATVIFEGDKLTGQFTDVILTNGGNQLSQSRLCVDRQQRVYFLVSRAANAPLPPGFQYIVGDVRFNEGPTGHKHIILRFDGSIRKLGFFQETVDLTISLPGQILVDSHDRLHLTFRDALDTSLSPSQENAEGLSIQFFFPNSNNPYTDLSIFTFIQADTIPLGVLVEDVEKGQLGRIILRGEASISNLFDTEDVGGIFKTLALNAFTFMTRNGGPPESSQMGFKTIATDQFIVDIHTSPAVGSDQ